MKDGVENNVKLKYFGISLAGFLLNFVGIAAAVGIYSLIVKFLEECVPLYILGGLLVCAGAGAVHGLFRRIIREKMQMKTLRYTLTTCVLPTLAGVIVIILCFIGVFGNLNHGWGNITIFLYSLPVTVVTIMGGLFGIIFDNIFQAKASNKLQ